MLALERHIKSIDLSEIEQQLNKEFDANHIQKIEKEVNESLNKIDWEKVQSDLKKAVSQAKQLEAEQVKQNMNQLKLELEKQKEHFQIDGKKLRIQVEEGVQKAMEGMQKAKEELNEINKLTNTLEKDGLIDKNKPFKTEVRNGELFINGTKQSTEVNEKYKSYFKLNDYSIDNNPGKKRTVVI
jgi:exonuclease VII large subunit